MADGQYKEPMTSVDRAWLGMDTETNLMIINGVMLFDQPVDYARLWDVLETRMVGEYPRFHQRIVESPRDSGRLYWEEDPYFDIRAHVRRVALPAPGDTAMLQSLVSDLMSADFDHNKPLWRAYLIEGYNGDGCALFMRFHHCISDGIALIRVMLSLTDPTPNPDTNSSPELPLTPLAAMEAPPPAKSRSRLGPLKPLISLPGAALGGVTKLTGMLYREGLHTISEPERIIEAAKATGVISAAGAAVLTRLVVIPTDRTSVFKGELGASKRIVWSDPVSLAEVKRIGKTLGGTVNDVLISALTGGLRNYMSLRNDDPDGGDLRAMVPVNLRPFEGDIELGNQFGLVYLSLPVTLADPQMRLYEVKRRMDILKSSPEAVLVYQVLNALGRLPGDLAAWATDFFASKASVVLTNVPGPRAPIYMAGVPVKRILFWVPQSGDIGLGLSIISYADEVSLGIVVDEKLVADPEIIMTGFSHEFELLGKLADQRSGQRSSKA